MGTIKDRNGRDLSDAEELKKRWKEYTEELYEKDLNEPDYYYGVVSHPEPDSLESEVKWALGSTAVNKAREYNGIPVELFKTLKDDAIKVLHSILSANLQDPAVATGLEKVSPHPNSRKVVLKNMLII